jgi:hypothetical protein
MHNDLKIDFNPLFHVKMKRCALNRFQNLKIRKSNIVILIGDTIDGREQSHSPN